MSTQSDAWPEGNSERLPEKFGRYLIVRLLGHGAMGEVYLARDTQLDRDVALKVPKLENKNKNLLTRFYREARASASLNHPYICPVHDVGEIDGIHYLTMAFIEGKTLAEYLTPGKPLNVRSSVGIVRKLALGLSEAHAQGILHRDLKPANIMIDAKKQPVIMDFGLATNIGSDQSMATQKGAILGTPAYMSPEQVQGKRDVIGPRSDLYGLGIILYQLITGHLPFEGPIAAVLGQILTVEPKRPSELRPSIDSELEAICLKAIAKNIDDRYTSTEEFAVALAEWLKVPEAERKRNRLSDSQEILEVIVEGDNASSDSSGESSTNSLFDFETDISSNSALERVKRGRRSSKQKKKTPAKQASIWDKIPPNVRWLMAAAGGGAFLILLGVIVFIRTRDQDIKIAVEDGNVTVESGEHGTLSAANAKDESGSIKTVVHDFADESSLDAFEILGRCKAHSNGGLEFLKGRRLKDRYGYGDSWAFTKQHYSLPISLSCKVFCESDAVYDIMPGLFGLVWLRWGGNFNQATDILVAGEKVPPSPRHRPIKSRQLHHVEMSIDTERTLTITIDGELIHKYIIPGELKMSGPAMLGSGIGHVIYKEVKITGKVLPPVTLKESPTTPGKVLWKDDFGSNRLAEYSDRYPSNPQNWTVEKGRLCRKSTIDSPLNFYDALALPISHNGDFVVEYTISPMGRNVKDANFRIGGTWFGFGGWGNTRSWIRGKPGYSSEKPMGIISSKRSTRVRVQRIGDVAKLFENGTERISLSGPNVSAQIHPFLGFGAVWMGPDVSYDDLLVRRPTLKEYEEAGIAPPSEPEPAESAQKTTTDASVLKNDDNKLERAEAPFNAARAKSYQKKEAWRLGRLKDETNSIGMSLCLIPPGEFEMGAYHSEKGVGSDEIPKHPVTISNAYYLGQTEVTRKQFQLFTEATSYRTEAETDGKGGHGWDNNKEKSEGPYPKYNWIGLGYEQKDEHPVVNVSWNDAVAFCKWLSQRENKKYRLPTEAEWEFACRAGTDAPWGHGEDASQLVKFANVRDQTARTRLKDENQSYASWSDGHVFAAQVKQFQPNAFGLYDMHGNVWEWCSDRYAPKYESTHVSQDPQGPSSGKTRVRRGGSWWDDYNSSRSARRGHLPPGDCNDHVGFRVVCEVTRTERTENLTSAVNVPSTIEKAQASTVSKTLSDQPKVTSNFTNAKPIGTWPPLAVAPFSNSEAAAHQQTWAQHLGLKVNTTNNIGMKFNLIPPGEFSMGAPDNAGRKERTDPGFKEFAQPRHTVKISSPFYFGTYEVTQKEYLEVVGTNPSRRTSSVDNPADSISWIQAVQFCNQLSLKEKIDPYYKIDTQNVSILGGSGYRLPTEAEWEYACRAGTETKFIHGENWKGIYAYAWTNKNSQGDVHEVGQKPPNAFGLYDIVGNVSEWCWDWLGEYDSSGRKQVDPLGPQNGTRRVWRGGGWHWVEVQHMAPWYRGSYGQRHVSRRVLQELSGFRVVRDVETKKTK